MVRKTSLVLLAVVALGGLFLVGCGQTPEPARAWKIGIISSGVGQTEEAFRMAEQMQSRYGTDRIVHAAYAERFMQDQEATITSALEMASDADVRAMVMVPAVPGTAAAIDRVREMRPEMLIIVGSPQEDPGIIAQKGDIVLNTDARVSGDRIAEYAHAMGAEVLVHYSFPRHMSVAMLAERRETMKARAEALGMVFLDEDAPDPMGDAGIHGTQAFIIEDVPRKIAEYGPQTAVFGTNCAMVEPLIGQAAEHGGLVPVECCPSPFHALPAALGIEAPVDPEGDVAEMLEAMEAALAEAAPEGRVVTWPVPVNMLFIEAGVEYAVAWINGEIAERVDRAALVAIMEEISGGSVVLTAYAGTENTFLYTTDHVVVQCDL